MAAKTDIFVGQVRNLPFSGRPTGIYKHAISGPMQLGREGFVEDQQADRRVHGGLDKAVHHYPASHYSQLAAKYPELEKQLVPGSLGENLSSGLTEADVCIGDLWRLGGALLQVCQPRNPCWKIDERFQTEGMALHIDQTGLTGWYCRVVETGIVSPGDTLILEESAAHALTLKAAMDLCATVRPDLPQFRLLINTPGISSSWQAKLQQRLNWLEKL